MRDMFCPEAEDQLHSQVFILTSFVVIGRSEWCHGNSVHILVECVRHTHTYRSILGFKDDCRKVDFFFFLHDSSCAPPQILY